MRPQPSATASTAAALIPLRPVRVGLWDTYGGSITSGWIRWLLEQMEIPFEVVYPPTLDAGEPGLEVRRAHLPRRGDPGHRPRGAVAAGAPGGCRRADEIPAEFRLPPRPHHGDERRSPRFGPSSEAGGRVITIGSSALNLSRHLALGVSSHLIERTPEGTVQALPREKFYVPASLLETVVDTTAPVAWGMSARTIVMFDESPAFRVDQAAEVSGRVRPVAWFASASPLRSGWAWGQTYLQDGIAAATASVGRGHRLPVRTGDHLSRAAAWNVQVPVQRDHESDRTHRRMTQRRRQLHLAPASCANVTCATSTPAWIHRHRK